MTVIVTDTGFGTDDLTTSFISLGEAANSVVALDVPSDAELSDLDAHLNAEVIRVDFPSSADGRGFTIARQLRLKGFTGRLRARGHVLADQSRQSGSLEQCRTQEKTAWSWPLVWSFECA